MRRINKPNELDANQRRNAEQLRDLESRLRNCYDEAYNGVKEKLDNFLEGFYSDDLAMLERVNAGLITQDEYIRWRTNKILRTRQMNAQIDSLAHDMLHVDTIAVDMLNGELPDVYCNSYAFGVFRGTESAAIAGQPVNSTFALYNADALRILQTENPDLIPWDEPRVDSAVDLAWNRQRIQAAVTQGILQGDSIRELSQRLLPVVNSDRVAATRTARTAYTSVQNQARVDATNRVRQSGIEMDNVWCSVLQANTRDTHLMLHDTLPNSEGLFGEGILPRGHLLRFPGDPLGQPEQVYNCQCCLNSFLHGIDHRHDDELYAHFMQENYFDDWQTVQHYRETETQTALERRERLLRETQRLNREEGNEVDLPEFYADPFDHNRGRGNITARVRERAADISDMTDTQIWERFATDDSFIDNRDFIIDTHDYVRMSNERDNLIARNRTIATELTGETIPKPQDQWGVVDRVNNSRGITPTTYTVRGQQLVNEMESNTTRITGLNTAISEISDRQDSVYRANALVQARQWHNTEHAFTRMAEGETFIGFSTSMINRNGVDLAADGGFIATMSPLEYLQRISYEIFGSSIEQTTAGIEYNNVRLYAQMMADGTQFDMGFIDYVECGQEGRHRAMAAYLLGIDRIPVYIRPRR